MGQLQISLCWKLKQVNLLEVTQQVVSVIEMTFLHAARYSIVLLRQKIRLTLNTKCTQQDLYGVLDVAIGA